MAIDIQCLTVEKVIVFTIMERGANKTALKPIFTNVYEGITGKMKDAFQSRITTALSSRSHGIEVEVTDKSVDGFFTMASTVLDNPDKHFITLSEKIATKLAEVQKSKDLAASKLIIVIGAAGHSSTPYLAVIKAELQDGFAEKKADGKSGLDFLEDLFLTQNQKLYKIGLIHATSLGIQSLNGEYDPSKYKFYLFDHLLTGTETRKAAHYFYSEFLGMSMSSSDKKITQDFYDNTKLFINSSDIDYEKKSHLLDTLRVELRSNQNIINVEEYADKNYDEKLKKQYIKFLKEKGFNQKSFSKDTEYIKDKLKKRQRMTFASGIELTAPADKLNEYVKIVSESIEQTTIVIKGKIVKQE